MLVQEVSLASSDLLTTLCISSLPRPEVPPLDPLTLLFLTICQDLYPKDLGELHVLHSIVSTRLSSLFSLLQGSFLV